MKRYLSIFLIFLLSLSLIGCSDLDKHKIVKTRAPLNESLSIKGIWEILSYEVLSDDVEPEEQLNKLIGNTIEIGNDYTKVFEEIYSNSSYKLKVVNKNYVISYESIYTVNDLNLDKDSTEVISVINKNNIIMEFFKKNSNEGFIFYNGVLFEVKFVGEINKEDDNDVNKNSNDDEDINNSNNEYNDPIGLYLGIKCKKENESEESYKTIFISFKDGILESKKRNNQIIMPRMRGIWTINKVNNESDGYRHEYFEAKSIESKAIEGKEENEEDSNFDRLDNTNIYRSIKYIGNDYIATEVYYGKDFKGEYNKYEVLPIDNINSELPINIGDIFSSEESNLFKQIYENTLSGMSDEEKNEYSKYINYSNFSLQRYNGKWNIIGKISPGNGIEGEGYDFSLNLRPNKKLINYDLLSIPWKTLKRKMPLIEDAYISPNNRIAIIVTNGKLLVYEIQNGELKDSPLGSLVLNSEDEIIMAEWCTGDYYVDRWGKPFLE